MQYILFVGSNNTLADLEVKTQIPGVQVIRPNLYEFSMDSLDEAKKVADRLGCSLKLAEKTELKPSSDSIASAIVCKSFSVTALDQALPVVFSQQIKNIRGGRFVASKDFFGLSPVIFTKHKVDEFFIFKNVVYKTVWVHNFRHWIQKDRHMPFFNAKAGMLPPKIARSMVNLVPLSPENHLLVDPFCGSGHILVEASEIGYKCFGSDIAAEQVHDTEANLHSLGFEVPVRLLDATHLSENIQEIDAIVTEPFLGKPNPRSDKIRYQMIGLEKLYLGSLKDWLKCLKPGGFVVMVFPVFFDGKHVYEPSKIIDDKQLLGYNQLTRGLMYSRPEAEVKREIVILQKK